MTSRCSMWSCSISCPSTTLRSHLFIPSHDSLRGTSDSEFSYHWFVGRLVDYALAAQILLLSATSNRYQLRLIHRHFMLVPDSSLLVLIADSRATMSLCISQRSSQGQAVPFNVTKGPRSSRPKKHSESGKTAAHRETASGICLSGSISFQGDRAGRI